MIKVELENWNEKELQKAVVNKVFETVIAREFKLYGNIPEEGCYTPYDKFKNQIANLVADRFFKYLINNEDITSRIDKAIENAENAIVASYMKDKRDK